MLHSHGNIRFGFLPCHSFCYHSGPGHMPFEGLQEECITGYPHLDPAFSGQLYGINTCMTNASLLGENAHPRLDTGAGQNSTRSRTKPMGEGAFLPHPPWPRQGKRSQLRSTFRSPMPSTGPTSNEPMAYCLPGSPGPFQSARSSEIGFIPWIIRSLLPL